MKKTQVSGMAFIQTIRVYQVKLEGDEERKKDYYIQERGSLRSIPRGGFGEALEVGGIMKGTNEKDEL
jgi:hypothetical protein